MDYNKLPSTWTIQSLVQGLVVSKEALKPLFTDIKDFFDHNSDITELRTYESRNRIVAEAHSLRAKHSSLFKKVPADTKFDKEVAEGCMKCIFNSRTTARSRNKHMTPVSSMTPAPSATPALSSPDQSKSQAYSTPISALLPEIPEHRLIIEFSRPCSQNVPQFETTPELLVLRNPSWSNTSAIRLMDVTRAVIVELLLEEGIMISQEESIWGVRESASDLLLSSTPRVVGYLQARCQAGTPRAFIHITPGIYSSLSAAEIESSHTGQLFPLHHLSLNSHHALLRVRLYHLTPRLHPHLLSVSVLCKTSLMSRLKASLVDAAENCPLDESAPVIPLPLMRAIVRQLSYFLAEESGFALRTNVLLRLIRRNRRPRQ